MRLPGVHRHVSERESAHVWPDGRKDDSRWEDCTMVAALMLARLCGYPEIPATHAEAEAIRAASGKGPLGGSSSQDALRGLAARRHVTGLRIVSNANFDALWAALAPGMAAAAQGSMGAFPTGHPLRRFDPPFASFHDVLVIRLDATDRVWWDDPLAPNGTYRGQWVSKADFKRYVQKFSAGSTLVGKVDTGMAVAAITSVTPALIDIANGSKYLALDGKTVLKVGTAAHPNQYSPFAVGNLRAWYVVLSGVRQVALVAPAAVRPVSDDTPFSQASIDAAKVAGASEGRDAERSRIKSLLGL